MNIEEYIISHLPEYGTIVAALGIIYLIFKCVVAGAIVMVKLWSERAKDRNNIEEKQVNTQERVSENLVTISNVLHNITLVQDGHSTALEGLKTMALAQKNDVAELGNKLEILGNDVATVKTKVIEELPTQIETEFRNSFSKLVQNIETLFSGLTQQTIGIDNKVEDVRNDIKVLKELLSIKPETATPETKPSETVK